MWWLLIVLLLLGVTVAKSTSSATMTLESARRVRNAWRGLASRYSAEYRFNLALILAIIATESGGNEKAVGMAGELGLMQLLKPARADVRASFGFSFTDAEMLIGGNCIRSGCAYLSLVRQRVGDDPITMLGSYNQGVGGFRSNPVARERGTKYAEKVLANKVFFDNLERAV